MSERGRFCYSDSEVYCVNSAYMMSGNSLKFICAVLNSQLFAWYKQSIAPSTGMGLTVWLKYIVEELPVPKVSQNDQQDCEKIFEQIYSEQNSDTEVSNCEAQIDKYVYRLFGLTAPEISLIHSQI